MLGPAAPGLGQHYDRNDDVGTGMKRGGMTNENTSIIPIRGGERTGVINQNGHSAGHRVIGRNCTGIDQLLVRGSELCVGESAVLLLVLGHRGQTVREPGFPLDTLGQGLRRPP